MDRLAYNIHGTVKPVTKGNSTDRCEKDRARLILRIERRTSGWGLTRAQSHVAGAPAYAAYFWLLQHLEAYKVTTVQWIEPLVAIIETALFLRLGLSFAMIAGSLVTLTSLLLVMRARAADDKNVSLLGN